MKTVFADTAYWAGIASPHDRYHEAAVQARDLLGPARVVTTEEVLCEFLALLREGGGSVRAHAVAMVRRVLRNPNVDVVPQTHDSFLSGLELYGKRLDKEYSLTDCISMNVMRERGITQVLTTDHHFEQEGFRVLIQSAGGAS